MLTVPGAAEPLAEASDEGSRREQGSEALEPTPASDEVLLYEQRAEPMYLRALLQELSFLAFQVGLYFAQRDQNSVDWDLGYDWQSFRDKIVGRAYAFDTNHFDTNFVSHQLSGSIYYLIARSNRVGVLGSLGYGAATSTIWELFGEFREKLSVNDLWLTPI